MRTLSVTFIFLFSCEIILAQKQGNIWYFGGNAGLDFNNGSPPVSISGGQTYLFPGVQCPTTLCHGEGTAVISDSSGSLLFYSNGEKIWNRNHLIMPNGDSLMGQMSSTQAALIVPMPGSSRYFYVFTTDAFYPDHDLKNGLQYSVVDMCLDGGMGDVIPSQKNIQLLDTTAEKVTAVRHANGIDYWIITHKYYSDAFYSFRLTASGMVDTVISHVGSRHPPGNGLTEGSIGQLKASPDGQKIVSVSGNFPSIAEYFDFDKQTGIVSNWVNLQSLPLNGEAYYGASFSPDNSKLYISGRTNQVYSGIFQYDLAAGNGNPDSVRASLFIFDTVNITYMGLQLGPDGKIYVARITVGAQGSYLGVIHNPNNAKAACNFVGREFQLLYGACSLGLPNFIDSYNYSNTTHIGSCNPTIPLELNISGVAASCSSSCDGSAIANGINGVPPYSYIWNPANDTTQFIDSLCPGIYYVEIKDAAGSSITDSVEIIAPIPLSVTVTTNKTAFCSGDSALVCASPGYAAYLWNMGQTDSCIQAKLAGNYYVTVTDNNGCTAESNRLAITVYPSPPVSISVNGDTLSVFNAAAQQWYLNGTEIGGATSNIYIVNQGGSYTVTITDSNGCRATSNPTFITGIENVSVEDVVNVYQLAVDRWQLTVGKNWLGSMAEVFDANGKLVFKSEINNPQSEIAAGVARGVYLLRISSSKSSVVKKLVRL